MVGYNIQDYVCLKCMLVGFLVMFVQPSKFNSG